MADLSVAIVDDHPVLRDGVAAVFERRAGFSFAASGSDASDICAISYSHRPDVMLVDLSMEGNVFKAIADAAAAAPEMTIIVFTASRHTDDAVQAFKAGAKGYVLKGSSADDLIIAIEAARRGQIYITSSFGNQVINVLRQNILEKRACFGAKLNVREIQIVKLLLSGKKNTEIAKILSLSERTVKAYMSQIMQKLQARSRLEVVLSAKQLHPEEFDENEIDAKGRLLSVPLRH